MPDQMELDYKRFKKLEKDAYNTTMAEDIESGRIPSRFASEFYRMLASNQQLSPENMQTITEHFNNRRISQQEYNLFKFVFDQCNGKTPDQAKIIMQQIGMMADLDKLADNGMPHQLIHSNALQRYNLFMEGKISGAEMDFGVMKKILHGNDAVYQDLQIAHFDYIWSPNRIDIIKDFYKPQSVSDKNQIFEITYTLRDIERSSNLDADAIHHVVKNVSDIVDMIIKQEIASPTPDTGRLMHFSNMMESVVLDIMRGKNGQYSDAEIQEFKEKYSVQSIRNQIAQKLQQMRDTIDHIATVQEGANTVLQNMSRGLKSPIPMQQMEQGNHK